MPRTRPFPTGAQVGGGGIGGALSVLIVWILWRSIGLSEGEIILLSGAMGPIFTGVGTYLAPYIPPPRHHAEEG